MPKKQLMGDQIEAPQELDYTTLRQNQLYQSQCVQCQITILARHPLPSTAVVQIRPSRPPKYTHTVTKPPEHIHRREKEGERMKNR